MGRQEIRKRKRDRAGDEPLLLIFIFAVTFISVFVLYYGVCLSKSLNSGWENYYSAAYEQTNAQQEAVKSVKAFREQLAAEEERIALNGDVTAKYDATDYYTQTNGVIIGEFEGIVFEEFEARVWRYTEDNKSQDGDANLWTFQVPRQKSGVMFIIDHEGSRKDAADIKNLRIPEEGDGCLELDILNDNTWYHVTAFRDCKKIRILFTNWGVSTRAYMFPQKNSDYRFHEDADTTSLFFSGEDPIHWEIQDRASKRAVQIIQTRRLATITMLLDRRDEHWCGHVNFTIVGEPDKSYFVKIQHSCFLVERSIYAFQTKPKAYPLYLTIGKESIQASGENKDLKADIKNDVEDDMFKLDNQLIWRLDHNGKEIVQLKMGQTTIFLADVEYDTNIPVTQVEQENRFCIKLMIAFSLNNYVFYANKNCDLILHTIKSTPGINATMINAMS